LSVAKQAFAGQGLEASLEGIAARADLVVGTLYRHFPTRLDLIESLFAEKVTEWLAAGEQPLAMQDAWQGFSFYLERLCELQAHHRGFKDIASMRFPTEAVTEQAQTRAYRLSRQIVRRAQRQGTLRPDLTPEDLAFLNLVPGTRHPGDPRHRPQRLASPPRPDARRLPRRARPPAPRASDDTP
jgi:AcrR family transcriptional regulator